VNLPGDGGRAWHEEEHGGDERERREDDKQDVAVPVDVVGERVLVTIGKREVVVHPSSIIGKEEVQRAWCVVAVGG
jgi:hypothetical protein